MKTGGPEYYIPSASTVGRDVRYLDGRCRQNIANMMKAYDGRVNFTSDTWTGPDHRPYFGVLAHFEHEGRAMCLPMDLIFAPYSHTGEALAKEFDELLKEFNVEEKVNNISG